MKNKRNKKKKTKKFNYFNVIYAILTIILIVLGFINIAYFSYDLIDNFVIQIIAHSIISLYIILALVQMLIQTHIKEYRIMAYLTTLSTLITLNSRFFISHNSWIFTLFIVSTLIICFNLIVYFLRKQKYYSTKFSKHIFIISFISILIYCVDSFSYNYENEMFMLWAFIPCVLILVILITLCFTLFNKLFKKSCPKIWQKIGIIFICFIFSYCFSMFGLSVINTSLSIEPETYSYEVVEKDIQSGARQITRYILTVEINGKKIDIDVSNDVYYEKEIGDEILVDYNQGALGFAYYEFSQENYN